MNKSPFVVVLILSYNGKHLLDDSISSYLSNDYENFEVVVIDNGSKDGTKDFVEKEHRPAKLIRLEENRGYSGGFNFGLEHAFNTLKADYVLVSNNDVEADSKVLSSLVKVAQTDLKIGFVTGKVYYYDQPHILQSVGKKEHPILWNGGHIGGQEVDVGQYEGINELPFADDIYTLVSREMFLEVGGYDSSFFLQGEEYDWQARAKLKGYKIFYTSKAKIWHKESMTIGKDSPIKSYYNFRNSFIVQMKYRKYSDFIQYFYYKRRHLVIVVFRNLIKLNIVYCYKSVMGFVSALKWGLKHKKIKFHQIFSFK